MKSLSIESKIAYLLERVSVVYKVLLWNLAKEQKLTPLQIQIMLFINNRITEECTPSNISMDLQITKATLSDAVKTLIKKGLIKKISFHKDRRSALLILTHRGRNLVKRIEGIGDTLAAHIRDLNTQEKEYALLFLIRLINSLYYSGLIKIARICPTCKFFIKDTKSGEDGLKARHICSLTDTEITDTSINVNCPKYVAHRRKKGGEK